MDFVKQREDLAPVREILDRYPREQRFLLAILQDIQKTYGYLPRGLWRRYASTWTCP